MTQGSCTVPQLYMILKIIFKIIFVCPVLRSVVSVGGGVRCTGSAGRREGAEGVKRATRPFPTRRDVVTLWRESQVGTIAGLNA